MNRQKLSAYARLARVNKPVGYFLLLWPVWWALWLSAEGVPAIGTLLIFTAGVFVMRSAGCAINDFADRDLDKLVERTKDRPLASGELSPAQALRFFALLAAFAFALVLLTNRWTILMSFVALALAASYPLMKRVHPLPQLHLGLAFGWAIPMAWTATTGTLVAPASIWLLYLATILWVLAYDTIYAMADRADDIKAGIKSSAILFGRHDRAVIAVLQLAVVLLLLHVGRSHGLGAFYHAALLIVAALFAWQQFLIKDRAPQNCLRAFTSNAWLGLVVFVGIAIELR